jgi:hypothetical protein
MQKGGNTNSTFDGQNKASFRLSFLLNTEYKADALAGPLSSP